jgi:hypothetical protein
MKILDWLREHVLLRSPDDEAAEREETGPTREDRHELERQNSIMPSDFGASNAAEGALSELERPRDPNP